MKKILTMITLVCLFSTGIEAKSILKIKKTYKFNAKKKMSRKVFYGSCGYGLLYDNDGAVNGYWSCWEGVNGQKSVTIWRYPQL